MGFKTFKEYLPVEYDSIVDHEQKLDAIVKNVEFLKNNIKNLEDDIVKDTEYNYKNFINLAHSNINRVVNFAKTNSLDIDNFDELVLTPDRPL